MKSIYLFEVYRLFFMTGGTTSPVSHVTWTDPLVRKVFLLDEGALLEGSVDGRCVYLRLLEEVSGTLRCRGLREIFDFDFFQLWKEKIASSLFAQSAAQLDSDLA